MPVPSVREVMTAAFQPVAEQMWQVGNTNTTYTALTNGDDVTLTPAALRYTTDHPSYPVDLDAFAEWVLSGDDTLTGVA